MADMRKCPRCEASIIEGTDYSGRTVGGSGLACSRLTRDDDGADVMICDRCGERESVYGRDPDKQVPMSDWPVCIEVLLFEERVLLTKAREGFRIIRGGDLDG